MFISNNHLDLFDFLTLYTWHILFVVSDAPEASFAGTKKKKKKQVSKCLGCAYVIACWWVASA